MNKKNLRTYEKVNKIMNYFTVGWLWIIMCLPIVTAGASSSAAYKVFKSCMENEEGYVIGQFFKAFKKEFKVSTIVWFIMLAAIGLVAGGSYTVVNQAKLFEEYRHLFIALYVLEGMLIYFILVYVFPYVTTFDDTPTVCIKNSFMISVRHIGNSMLILLADIAIIGVSLLIYFFLMFAPAILLYVNAMLIRKVLNIYKK